MTDSDENRQLDAAEYVIGTLSAVERKAFDAAMETDSATRDDVMFWERILGALNSVQAPVIPPSDIWERIAAALPVTADLSTEAPTSNTVSTNTAAPSGVAANDNLLEKLRRSRRRWRMGAIAASILAVAFGGLIANQQLSPAPGLSGQEYIAVVNANGDQPSLVINVNAITGDVTVRSVGVDRPDGKSLELWYVPEGQKAVSVGLVGEGGIDLKDITAKAGDLLAISLEPQGGSPTGVATGPVIYTGKLIENVDTK